MELEAQDSGLFVLRCFSSIVFRMKYHSKRWHILHSCFNKMKDLCRKSLKYFPSEHVILTSKWMDLTDFPCLVPQFNHREKTLPIDRPTLAHAPDTRCFFLKLSHTKNVNKPG